MNDNDSFVKNYGNVDSDNDDDNGTNSDLEARLYAEIYYSSDKTITVSEEANTTNISNVNNSWQNVLEEDTLSFKRIETISNRTNVEDEYVTKKQDANRYRLRSSTKRFRNYLHEEDISRSEMICNKDLRHKNRTDVMDLTYTGQSSQSKRIENVTKQKQQSAGHSTNRHKDDINHSSKSNESKNSPSKNKKESKVKHSQRVYKEFLNECFSNKNSNKNVKDSQRHVKDIGSHKFPSNNVNSYQVRTKSTEVSNTEKQVSRRDAKKNKNCNKTNIKVSPNIPRSTQRENIKNRSVAKHIKFDVSNEDVEIIQNSEATKQNSENFSDDSEDSIFEVPVPPKPKPPLITLQDSDHDPIESDNDDCVSISSSSSDNDVNRLKQTNKLVSESLNPESIPVIDAPRAVHTSNSLDETLKQNINTDVSSSDTNAHCSKGTSSQEISTDSLEHHESMSSTNIFESICTSSSVDNIESSSNQDSNFSVPNNNLRQSPELPSTAGNYNPPSETLANEDIVQIEEFSQSSHTEQANDKDQCQDSFIFNYTEVQKGVATLTEIREMSGTVQSIQVDNNDGGTKSKTTHSIETIENRTYVNEKVVDSYDGNDLSSENENDFDENVQKRPESRRSIEEIQINVSCDKYDSVDESNDIHASLSPVKNVSGCSASVSKERYTVTRETVEMNNVFSKTKKRQSENVDNVRHNTKQRKYDDGDGQPSGSRTNAKKQKNENNKNQGISEEDYFFQPMSNKLKSFYNESWGGEYFDLEKIHSQMPRHPKHWAILDDDLIVHSSMRRGRYWTSKRCTQCYCDGHTWANCPNSRKPAHCHMCGIKGHSEPRCPQKMCLTCGKKQTSFMKTCESCQKLHCFSCNATGHKKSTCPDLWRRYHQTTNASEINVPESRQVVMKPSHLLNCSNCARRGHDSSTCNKYRWSQHFITPVYVTKYMDDLTGTMHVEYNTLNDTSKKNIVVRDEQFAYTKNQECFENHSLSMSNAPTSSLLSNVDLEDPVETNVGVAPQTAQSYILFTCGSCSSKTHRYKTLIKTMNDIDGAILTGLQKGHVLPWFLHDLKQRVPFNIQIERIEKTVLQLQIKSTKEAIEGLWNLMRLWVQREDNEKMGIVCKNLSFSKRRMYDLLSRKLEELDEDLGDPVTLWKGIQRLNNTIKQSMQKGSSGVKYIKSLAKLQCKLVLIHAKSMDGCENNVSDLRKLLCKLSKAKRMNQMTVKLYLTSVYIFNKLFTPHTPPQLQNWFNAYYNSQKDVQSDVVEPACESPTKKSCQASMKVYQDESNKISSLSESSENTVVPYSYVHNELNSYGPMTSSNSDGAFALATSSTFQNPLNLEIHATPHGRLVNEITNEYATNVSNSNSTGSSNNYYQTSSESNALEETYNDTDTHDFRLQNRTLIEIPLIESTQCEPRENLQFNSEKYLDDQNILDSNDARCDGTSFNVVPNHPIQTNSKDEQNYSEIQVPLASNCTRHNIFNISGSQTKINITNHFKTHAERQIKYQEAQLRLQKRLAKKAKIAIKFASKFKQPYMIKAIEQLQDKMDTKNLTREHIKSLNRMVMCETSHHNLMKKMYTK